MSPYASVLYSVCKADIVCLATKGNPIFGWHWHRHTHTHTQLECTHTHLECVHTHLLSQHTHTPYCIYERNVPSVCLLCTLSIGHFFQLYSRFHQHFFVEEPKVYLLNTIYIYILRWQYLSKSIYKFLDSSLCVSTLINNKHFLKCQCLP